MDQQPVVVQVKAFQVNFPQRESSSTKRFPNSALSTSGDDHSITTKQSKGTVGAENRASPNGGSNGRSVQNAEISSVNGEVYDPGQITSVLHVRPDQIGSFSHVYIQKHLQQQLPVYLQQKSQELQRQHSHPRPVPVLSAHSQAGRHMITRSQRQSHLQLLHQIQLKSHHSKHQLPRQLQQRAQKKLSDEQADTSSQNTQPRPQLVKPQISQQLKQQIQQPTKLQHLHLLHKKQTYSHFQEHGQPKEPTVSQNAEHVTEECPYIIQDFDAIQDDSDLEALNICASNDDNKQLLNTVEQYPRQAKLRLSPDVESLCREADALSKVCEAKRSTRKIKPSPNDNILQALIVTKVPGPKSASGESQKASPTPSVEDIHNDIDDNQNQSQKQKQHVNATSMKKIVSFSHSSKGGSCASQSRRPLLLPDRPHTRPIMSLMPTSSQGTPIHQRSNVPIYDSPDASVFAAKLRALRTMSKQNSHLTGAGKTDILTLPSGRALPITPRTPYGTPIPRCESTEISYNANTIMPEMMVTTPTGLKKSILKTSPPGVMTAHDTYHPLGDDMAVGPNGKPLQKVRFVGVCLQKVNVT